MAEDHQILGKKDAQLQYEVRLVGRRRSEHQPASHLAKKHYRFFQSMLLHY